MVPITGGFEEEHMSFKGLAGDEGGGLTTDRGTVVVFVFGWLVSVYFFDYPRQ